MQSRTWAAARIPFMVKLCWTLVAAAVGPAHFAYYGARNFLWFSDTALFISAAALWPENTVLLSMEALAVSMFEIFWSSDFLLHLFSGRELSGAASYMFDDSAPLLIRALSLFHLVLPVILPWSIARTRYRVCALPLQTLAAWSVLVVCRFMTPQSENINYAFGADGRLPLQHFFIGMLLLPVLVYFPSHALLKKISGRIAAPLPEGALRQQAGKSQEDKAPRCKRAAIA